MTVTQQSIEPGQAVVTVQCRLDQLDEKRLAVRVGGAV